MRYASGQEVLPGDKVRIDTQYRGTVVGCIAEAKSLPPHTADEWAFLKAGVMIDTDFGGLVHYPDESDLAGDQIELVARLESDD